MPIARFHIRIKILYRTNKEDWFQKNNNNLNFEYATNAVTFNFICFENKNLDRLWLLTFWIKNDLKSRTYIYQLCKLYELLKFLADCRYFLILNLRMQVKYFQKLRTVSKARFPVATSVKKAAFIAPSQKFPHTGSSQNTTNFSA